MSTRANNTHINETMINPDQIEFDGGHERLIISKRVNNAPRVVEDEAAEQERADQRVQQRQLRACAWCGFRKQATHEQTCQPMMALSRPHSSSSQRPANRKPPMNEKFTLLWNANNVNALTMERSYEHTIEKQKTDTPEQAAGHCEGHKHVLSDAGLCITTT